MGVKHDVLPKGPAESLELWRKLDHLRHLRIKNRNNFGNSCEIYGYATANLITKLFTYFLLLCAKCPRDEHESSHHHHHVLYFEKKVDRRNLTM